MVMRTFLLIVGIVLIVLGLFATALTLGRMGGCSSARPSPGSRIMAGSGSPLARPQPATLGDAIFCAVLYAAGFVTLYLRPRITKPT